MSDVVVWSAGMVIPITAPSILDGAVAVRDGRIEHVGARDWVINTLTQRGLSFTERHFDGVLLPGLVNAHTHLQYTGMASVGAGQYRGFDSWARAFDEVYDAGGLDWGGDAATGARLLLESGTTAAASPRKAAIQPKRVKRTPSVFRNFMKAPVLSKINPPTSFRCPARFSF